MADENEAIQNNTLVPKAKNGWILCRSEKRPGFYYDFNTITGEAVWRDGKTAHTAAIMDSSKVPFDCQEPSDPPIEPKPPIHQTTAQTSPAPKIYNKQIINNQYPAKPYAIAPYGNPSCTSCSLLTPNIGVHATPLLVAPTQPQYLLGPAVTPLNQVQSIFEGIDNTHLQTSSLSSSNRFQVVSQLNADFNLREEVANEQQSSDCHQPYRSYNHPMKHRTPVKNHFNKHPMNIDLREKLTSRRRRRYSETDAKVVDRPDTNKDLPANVTEDDLDPDDSDSWVKAHTDGEGRRLNITIESIWDLAGSSMSRSRNCCYIIPTTRVLLNNMRFLSSLVLSDERIRLLTPRDVVRTLRSAAFSDSGRLADYASRARTFAIRQLSKVPDNLKDTANVKACMELIGLDIHVIRLVDEKDIGKQETINDDTMTTSQLKLYLSRTASSKPKTVTNIIPKTVSNIKITVPNDEIPEFKPQVTNATMVMDESPTVETHSLEKERTAHKEIEIQTDLTTPSGKQTANACVQTDFNFPLISTEIYPQIQINGPVHGTKTTSHKEPDLTFTPRSPDEICRESKLSQMLDAAPVEAINESTGGYRKIKLKRLPQSNTGTNSEEKKTFKWRKRKSNTDVLPAQDECCQRSSHEMQSSSPATSGLSNHYIAVDCRRSDASVSAKMVDQSSSSGVISNSVDSDTMFKINKQVLINEPSLEDCGIVTYEVTSDCMYDRLKLRCDEWVSRFVQIMEEVLSQVLLLEPAFADATLRPPWTLKEAAVCINRKFNDHRIIRDASDKLSVFLMKINDDRGNIESCISPTDFMQMYTYGLNLVNKLQVVLKDCDDVVIASQNLSKLLAEIRDPNLDECYEMETLDCEEPTSNSPNISEMTTDFSAILRVPENVPSTKASPKSKDTSLSCVISPGRYTLRSRSRPQPKLKKDEAEQEAIPSETNDYTLFSSLGLQQKKLNVDNFIAKTISNAPSSPRLEPMPDVVSHNIRAGEENDNKVEPKIIRNFKICPDLEKKLLADNGVQHKKAESDYCTDGYYNANNVNDPASIDFAEDVDFSSADFTEDDNAIDKPHHDDMNGGMLQTTRFDVDQNCESTKLCDSDARSLFNKVVRKITYKYRIWLKALNMFCVTTYATMKSPNFNQVQNHSSLKEKITKVTEHAKKVCKRLKCILDRDPSVTNNDFRQMIRSYGNQYSDVSDLQLADYRVMLENYLELAERLLTCVTRFAESVKTK